MALSYLANSAGIYGETMHAVVHYVGITITDEEMQEWRVMAKKVAREVIPNT